MIKEVESQNNRYLPIDGIRAFSVVWLIGFHTIWFIGFFNVNDFAKLMNSKFTAFFWSGFYGVDMFFVLSGFLITTLLLGELEKQGSLSFKKFYTRRFFRIIPVYILAISAFVIIFQSKKHWPWENILLVNNYYPFNKQSMFWTWSLAMEEQFYILLPIVMTFFHRWTKNYLTYLWILLGITFLVRWLGLMSHPYSFPQNIPPLMAIKYLIYIMKIFTPKATCDLAGLLLALFSHTRSPTLAFGNL